MPGSKRGFCLALCIALLFLSGCRTAQDAPSASAPAQNAPETSRSSLEDAKISEAQPPAQPDFAGRGLEMSRETYFGQERYVDWNQSLFRFGRAVRFPTDQLVLTPSGGAQYKETVIYEVPAEIQGEITAFLPGDYVFYYTVDNGLYRVFYPDSPNCETERIFSSEQPFFFWLLTNYRTLIGFESEEFKAALERVESTGVDEKMPQQYVWYVLDTRSGELQKLPERYNYSVMDEEQRERLFPLEEPEDR